MNEFIENFHWLRPFWLLGLLPALTIVWMLWKRKRGAGKWHELIAPELIPHLMENSSLRPRLWQIYGLLIAWLITCLALAGPAWEKRAAPVHISEDALVIVLDLSPSMLAEDITPSRLIRARLKIADILRERRDGQTALLAYAGDTHVVAPLTDDTSTIANLLTALHPELMPVPGSNTEAAIGQAIDLLRSASAISGDILLITDGVVGSARRSINDQLQDTPYRLSILGVGTEEGAPIPRTQSGFVRDRNNNIVIAQLNEDQLRQLARRANGRYHRLTNDRTDIDWLLSQPSILEQRSREVEREFDSWYDRGHWLVLLLIPVLLYSFRRGLVLSLCLCIPLLALYPNPSYAFSWRDLWLTPDQRGQRDLEQGEAEQAAREFRNPQWRGSAQYRAGDYPGAAETFSQLDTPKAHYNRGNALARAGQLREALTAYDQALEYSPDWEDAQFNRNLVAQLLEQQDQQNDGDGERQEDEDSQQENGDPQDQNEQSRNNQSQEQTDDQMGESDEEQSQEDSQDDQFDDQQDDTQTPDDESAHEKEEQQERGDDEGDDSAEPELNEEMAHPDELSEEERQALEQWLRRVPDDPGGLLRRKFEYQHQQQRMQRLRGNIPAPTESEERW